MPELHVVDRSAVAAPRDVAGSLTALIDLVPAMPLPLLSEALSMPVDGEMREKIVASRRLRRIVGCEVGRAMGLPPEVVVPGGPVTWLLLTASEDDLERTVRRCAARLVASRIRRALRGFEIAELRAIYGVEAFEAALEHDGQPVKAAADLPGVEAGRAAMASWIGRLEPVVAAYLTLRFSRTEAGALRDLAGSDPDPTLAAAFETCVLECHDG